MVDIRNPQEPTFAGCYSEDGYVHDAQCVVYSGPDTKYSNKEICFCYNEGIHNFLSRLLNRSLSIRHYQFILIHVDTLTIVDVTNKDDVLLISRTPYVDNQYTHQGWLLPGSKWLLLNDELDELDGVEKTTRTLLWNVESLESTSLIKQESFLELFSFTNHFK